MQPRPTILLFLLTCLLSTLPIQAQQKGFTNYSLAEGLPQSKITCLWEDSRGMLWVGSQSGGLSRYTGKSFETFTTQEGLLDNHILSLYEDEQGILWIGTLKGICLYDGKGFRELRIPGGKKQAIHSMWQQSDGKMWIGSTGAVFTYENENWQEIDPENTFDIGRVSSIFGERNGAVWVGHSKGLLRILGSEMKAYTPKNDGLNSRIISDITEDEDGTIWISSILGGVHRFNGRRFVPQFINTDVHEGFITDLHFDAEGNLWISSQYQGVFKYDFPSNSWEQYGKEKDLESNHVVQVIHDTWGNTWMATLGGGLSKFTRKNFIHYDSNHGLRDENVLAFAVDSTQQIWMGTSGKGIFMYDGNRFKQPNGNQALYNFRVTCLFKDRKNHMWVGTQGKGLGLYLDSTFHLFPNQEGFTANIIRDIKEDKSGKLWIATQHNGIFQIEPKQDSTGIQLAFNSFRKETGLLSNSIQHLHFDKKDRLWYATNGKGIGYIGKDMRPGKTPNLLLDGLRVRTLAEDEKGYLWIGTANQGIFHMYLYGREFSLGSHPKALISDEISFILPDKNDQLWIGTAFGLEKVLLDFERNFTHIRHFGREDGLFDIEINQNAALLDSQGSLWLGSNSGLSIYQPFQDTLKASRPRIFLEEIQLSYKPLESYPQYKYLLGSWGKILHPIKLESNENNLIFEFNGIDLSQEGALRYQYRMKGLNRQWSPPQEKRDISYPGLAPGTYTFQVKALNTNNLESEVLEISLSIDVPIYQRPWFIAANCLLLALLIYLFFRIRLNQVRKIARIDQEKIQIEKDLIELEQKALRLQMNPHFLFNALNSIQGLIAREDSKNARYYLAKFSKLMRLVLENSRQSMIPLSDEIETLQHYLTVEQFSSGEKFTYDMYWDESIDTEITLIPPMMIQPFIENAIIHGIAHKKEKGEISVAFKKIGNRIECSVQDNGVGRKKAAEMKSQQAHNHKSTALLVTQERLDILSQGADWGKSIEMVDLVDSKGKASGTKVILRIPLILDL